MGRIKTSNRSIDTFLALADLAQTRGKFKEASKYYQAVLAVDPHHAFSLYNLGIILKDLQKVDEAIECFKRVIKLDPTFINPYDEIGFACEGIGKPEEARAMYEKAISIDPSIALLHNNLGNAIKMEGKPRKAIPCYEIAVALKPDYADAYNNMGTAYHMFKKDALAKKYLNKAIELNPKSPIFYYNLGIVHGEAQQLEAAVDSLTKAITIDPKFIRAYSHLYSTKRQMCDWSNLENIEKSIDDLGYVDPFISIMKDESFANNYSISVSKSQVMANNINEKRYQHNPTDRKNKKIRLGYLSNDFRYHPIGQLVASMFFHHDRKKFETFAYSYGKNDKSEYRKNVENSVDNFFDIGKMTFRESAKKIYDDKIDILIDITGYTLGNKLEICALRPAPIQVTWLGFPGTSGASFFDYAIVDKIIAPPEKSLFFSEKLVYLPRCYQVNNNKIRVSKNKFKRTDFGLPEKGFVFASFNQSFKIEPTIFKVWMNILKLVPDSVLWLWKQDKFSPKYLKAEAKKAGIDPKRIVFANKMVKSKHLKRMGLADLGLDTRVYGGHTTTSDMLWAGVPVLTKTGNHFASRVCTSILLEAKLPELVTTTLEEYEKTAVFLAQNPKILKQIRSKITHEHLLKNLYDTKGFVADLENAYKKMFEIYQDQENPKLIEIK